VLEVLFRIVFDACWLPSTSKKAIVRSENETERIVCLVRTVQPIVMISVHKMLLEGAVLLDDNSVAPVSSFRLHKCSTKVKGTISYHFSLLRKNLLEMTLFSWRLRSLRHPSTWSFQNSSFAPKKRLFTFEKKHTHEKNQHVGFLMNTMIIGTTRWKLPKA
jgi:hypothetical protein